MAGSAWTNQIQNTVIVAGPTGTITGFFVYSGTPGPGNPPVGSWTIPGTTQDPFGNAILPNLVVGPTGAAQVTLTISGGAGILKFPVPTSLKDFAAAFAATTEFVVLGPQDLVGTDRSFITFNAGNGTSSASFFIAYGDGNGGSNTQLEGTFAGLQLPVVASMSAVAPGSGTSITNPATSEGWHNMSLLNSWTATGGRVTPKYRLVPSPPNSFEVIGSVTAPAGLAGASNIWAIPSAYQLTDGPQPLVARNVSTGAAVMLSAAAGAGDLSYQFGAAAGNVIDFHGFFSMDA